MPWRVVAYGGLAIVAFDALASYCSKAFGFEYGLAVFGSWLIYALVGRAAARGGGGLRVSALAGLAVALVEATAGWAVSAAIGPGRIEDYSTLGNIVVVLVVVFVTAGLGAVFGWIGGRSAVWSRSRAQA